MTYRYLVLLLLFSLVLAFGCGRKEKDTVTGVVVPPSSLPDATFYGSSQYAVVKVAALPGIYDDFRDVLGDIGIVNWDTRFDCNWFASLYISTANAHFASAAWHSETPAQSLALGEFWYHRDQGGWHAIVTAVTDQGVVFIEPQTGRLVKLTAGERQSRRLSKW